MAASSRRSQSGSVGEVEQAPYLELLTPGLGCGLIGGNAVVLPTYRQAVVVSRAQTTFLAIMPGRARGRGGMTAARQGCRLPGYW
jgi:hypothetical protein